MRILLVEDNADHRELMSLTLTGHDPTWQVEEVASGGEALRRLAEEEVYDLVLLDYSLPGRDGLGVLEQVRRVEAPPPVVVVTGRGDEQVAVEAIKGGAYDYVVKAKDYLQRLPVVAQRAIEAHQLAVERKRAEETLQRRNRDLELLNRASQVFNSTLEMGQMLVTALEEVRRLLGVAVCSVWLFDAQGAATDDLSQALPRELVCRQATGPHSDLVRSWRLAPGQGIAGWVARHGKPLNVPDTQADARHFKEVDRQTGVELRSILSVPLRAKREMIGVLQLGDTTAGRFDAADLSLVESLAATAAIAIENTQMYEQVQQDAETKATLLREVNHHVKNNLTAIIGLLYTEQSHAEMAHQAAYRTITQNLINRVGGLSTVHSLLSASEWAPLLLSDLAGQVVRSSLQTLPRDKGISVEVTPSPARVTPDQAHNLALVINELVTNTVKHALQERDRGYIAVRIALENGDGGGDDTVRAARTVRFEFRDDGPGYAEDVLQLERYSVGFDLIQSMVHQGLRGELSLHNDRGAVAVIRFKAQA